LLETYKYMEFQKIPEQPIQPITPSQQAEGNKSFGQQFNPEQSKFSGDKTITDTTPASRQQLKKIWLSVVVLIVVASLGAGVWWYYNNRIANSLPDQPVVNDQKSVSSVPEENTAFDDNPITDNQPVEPPSLVDSDNDGLSDDQELNYGTNPLNPDSDGDGYLDGQEVANGYNPLGEGLLVLPIDIPETNNQATTSTPEINTFDLATTQNTADAMAYAINNSDTELLLKVISPNNPSYEEIAADPAGFLALYQYTFEFKKVRIEVVSETPEQYPDTVTIATKIYVDDQLSQEGSSRLEKINSEWKVLQ